MNNWEDDEEDNPDCTPLSGETALFMAVADDEVILLELLLKAGADPRLPAFGDVTPLEVAEKFGKEDCLTPLRQEYHHIGFSPRYSRKSAKQIRACIQGE